MNDPVLAQGESEGTPVPAPQADTITSPSTSPITRPPAPQPKPIPQPPSAATVPPKVEPAPVPVSRASWENDLEVSAASTGVSADLMRKIAGRESGGNPNARASTSSAAGIFQITGGTWRGLAARYGSQLGGLTNHMDPNQQARVAPYYMKEIQATIHRKLGRAPDDAESYIGWFLGAGGAARALSADPSTPISAVVDPAALAANQAVFSKANTVGKLYEWASKKMSGSGVRAAYTPDTSSAAEKYSRMGLSADPTSGSGRVPFTGADDALAAQRREQQALSLTQAAVASASQDWTTSWLLSSQGKNPFDPNFRVTQELLARDAKGLPENYLPYLGRATSEQDFEYRLRQSERDHEVEQRLAATPYGPGVRMAVALADPAGIALGILAPVGLAAKAAQVGRAGMLAATLADGAIGGVASELPVMLNKPGYDDKQALWAAVTGAGMYTALNRGWAKAAPHVAPEVESFIGKTTALRTELEDHGTFGVSSAGAAQVPGYREPVRGDIEDWLKVETPETAYGAVRFDFAKLKNSKNPVVAALADAMGLDTVGNADKTVAVTRPIEHERRMLETRATTLWSREYVSAADDYRTRHGIGSVAWKLHGEDAFQREITAAVRNTDPLVAIDPAAKRMATAWQDLAGWWRERAVNPGKDRGETMRPLPFAEAWSDAKDYVPRYVAWDRWRELNANFGTQQMRTLIGRAIQAKNPDFDADLSLKLGGWYYDRIRSVEAGQELTGQRAFSSVDVEAMRKSLTEGLGLSEEEVGKVLFQATANDEAGKAITSRQKMRTHMAENFSLPLTGRDGVTRSVFVHEMWEDNMRSIVHAYNAQMAGAVSLGQLRIANPRHIPERVVDGEIIPGTPKYLVDGIHSDGDWDKLMAQARAVDDRVRYEDGRKTVESEVKNLQWMKDTITGVPHDFDRTRWGQLARIVQKLNFVRLMSQSGFASIAELGQITAQTGWKHALQAVPHLEDFRRDALTGKLGRDVLEDFEYTFGVATDHLRGSGATMQSPAFASNLMETGLSRRLDRAEKALELATRGTSMLSLVPVTVFSERVAQRAVLSKFRAAAIGDEALSAQRMRIIGLDHEMQERVLRELRKHAGTVEQDGQSVQVLGLDKWDEQVRSAFEFAVSTWVRRIIQQNDLGQMNAVLGHPLAKLLFQFRSFTLGAWSKQTLSSIHMRDWEAIEGFFASMVFGGAAYTAQTALNGLGLSGKDREDYVRKRLSDEKIVSAAIQRAGQSSLLPGFLDLGGGVFGFEPIFDTRSTGQPTQGLASNPTFGLIDGLHKGARTVAETALHGDSFTAKDARLVSRAVNLLHNYPLVLQTINATSSGLSAQ